MIIDTEPLTITKVKGKNTQNFAATPERLHWLS